MRHFIKYLSFVGCLLLWACGQKPTEEERPEHFVLSDTMMRRIKIDYVKDCVVLNELKLNGKVQADEEKVLKVYPLTGGIVTEVGVELGDYVEKGKTLAVIKSSEVADFERQLYEAEANVQIAQKTADATADMYKSKLASEKEYITSQRELEKAKAEEKRLKEVFNIYNIDKNSQYIIKAPISGYVIEKKINRDMKIRSDMQENIFTISELSDVWVVANVYESDIANVKVGYDADITTLSYPDKVLKGKVDKIFTVLDPLSKVMKIRIKLDNKDNILKPEMFAHVVVTSAEDESFPCILSRAIIFDKSKNFVMVYRDPAHIETREIEIYKTAGQTTYIKHGLREGERIVSQGHMLIYDQLND